MMAVVSEIVGLKFLSILTKWFPHLSLKWVLQELDWQTNIMNIVITQCIHRNIGSVASQELIAKTCTPGWEELTSVILFEDLTKNKLALIIVITTTTWVEYSVYFAELVKDDFLAVLV